MLMLSGLKMAVEAMLNYGGHEQVQIKVIKMLKDMGMKTEYKDPLIESGAVQGVVKALKRYARSSELAHLGCWALGNLTASCFEAQQRASDLEGVQIVVRIMQLHPRDSTVQLRGCHAIASCARGHTFNSATAGTCGGTQAVVDAIDTHSSKEGVVHK
ncbi:hypothetical protein CYMTET_33114, partial [Cymbomonas tetramitiformis]